MISEHICVLSEPHFMFQITRSIISCIEAWNLQENAARMKTCFKFWDATGWFPLNF